VGFGAVNAPRVARRSWTTRLSTGHVVMILAGLLGVALTLGILRSGDQQQAVLVAADDLVPGTVIDHDAVRVDHVSASHTLLSSAFAPHQLDELEGRVVSATISRGALLSRDSVEPRADAGATRSMSFPLPKARAMGGALDTGDHVDVVAVQHDGFGAGYVMTDVDVLAVDGARGGPLGTSDDLTVTLAVDSDSAVRLAAALEGGTVTLVRSTGAAAATTAPRYAGAASELDTGR
jgi:Flp pilus assembly protein CpaB